MYSYIVCLVWIEFHVACMQTECCWSCLYHIASWTALLCRLVPNNLIILWTPFLKYLNAGTWVWSLKIVFWVGSPPPCLLPCSQTFTYCFMNYYLYVKKGTAVSAWIHKKIAVQTYDWCILRYVIPVVLSNNKNKLNGTYVYRHKHNHIPYSMFTITKVQLHVSAINVGHLQVVHEALNNKLCLHVSGEFTVCGVGWVRDLVLCL